MFLADHDRARATIRYTVVYHIKDEKFALFNGRDFDSGYPHHFEDQQTACNTAKIEADKIAAAGSYPVRRSIAVQRKTQHGDKLDIEEIMTLNIEPDSQRVDMVAEVLP